jgi:predicted N-acyltransferase
MTGHRANGARSRLRRPESFRCSHLPTIAMRAPVPFSPAPLPALAAPVVRDDVALSDIAPAAWDALGGGQPFLRHAFLDALHETGCASPATGWTPRYITAWQAGVLVGAMPLYEKTHSYGEYVFDWGWADAYRRHGRRYYPKLLGAVPFTPVPGPRVLAADPDIARSLLAHARDLLRSGAYSSLHVLFPPASQSALAAELHFTMRTGVQFHWQNPGYRDFADFLAALTHDKRKKIRQEQRKLATAGVTFERKCGAAITSADWDFFYRCYENTYRAHHSTPYLSRRFFGRIGERLPEHMLLVMAHRGGNPLACALDVFDADTLWGRYWGAIEYVPGLHFETCYYQAIDFCIDQRIARFEGGAQGVHKLARGLLPVTTYSWHAIGDRDFGRAIADFCARERVDVAHTVDELESASPFRQVE